MSSSEQPVKDQSAPPEMTVKAVVLGIVIGLVFGAANAYLGLRVGLTVSASIPAAVMSIAVFGLFNRLGWFGRATVLENNLVQTIGSAGESLAAGIIFTIPALILLGQSPGVLKIFVLGAIGGLLGVLFMIPFRYFLIVKEHGRLVYPEGTACAGVLLAGQAGGKMGRLVFAGLGLGAVYEFLVSGLGLWKSAPSWKLPRLISSEVSADASPALLGVGYVIGPRIAAIMFSGGALAWLVFIPVIKFFGGSAEIIFPASVPIAELDAHGVWHHYVRYIGAGAVVFGGFVTLVRALPVIVSSAGSVFADLRQRRQVAVVARSREERDLPGKVILGGVGVCILAMSLLPRNLVPGEFLPSLLAVVFAFFFVAVSSRIVGLIGSSSNPISGMTIASLLATTLIFKLLGLTDSGHQAVALAVGAIVCLAAAIAGDTSQDLKTGYLVGATPWRMQVGEMIGVLSSAAVLGLVVLRLHKAYGLGSEALPAPQATLMAMVVKGVLSGDLPWTLVFIGMATAGVIEILGLPALPFAVGLYLPLSLSTPILLGGIIRAIIDRKKKSPEAADSALAPAPKVEEKSEEPAAARKISRADDLTKERGVLFASGLIAGAAFVGMAWGLLRSLGENPALEQCLKLSGWRACFFESPLATLQEVIRLLPLRLHIGPEWAGPNQDLVAFVALLLAGGILFWFARPAKEDSPDPEEK